MAIVLEDIPHPGEIARIIDAYFDAAPIQVAYAVFEGDGPADSEDLDELEQERTIVTAIRYLWLKAARKRLEKP